MRTPVNLVMNNTTFYQYPRTGEGFVMIPAGSRPEIIVIRNRYSYVSGALWEALEAGKSYYVLFYANRFHIPSFQPCVSSALETYLSSDSLFFDKTTWNDTLPLPFTPQVRNPDGRFISDTLGWMPVGGRFLAAGGERFINLGNYQGKYEMMMDCPDDSIVRPLSFWIAIDDVAVLPITGRNQPALSLCPGSHAVLRPSWFGYALAQWQDGSLADSFTAAAPGTYYVTYDSADYAFTDTFHVEGPLFSVSLPDTAYLCRGEAITVTLPRLPGVRYQWSTGDTLAQKTFSSTGYFSLTATHGQCKTYHAMQVKYGSSVRLPSRLFEDSTYICRERAFVADLTAWNAQVRWQDGSNEKMRSFHEDGDYAALLYTTCDSLRDTLRLRVIDCTCQTFVPTAFTPNSDALNDVFRTVNMCGYQSYSLRIFNPYSNRIYSTSDPTRGWDGTYKGEAAPEGVHRWKLETLTSEGQKESLSGLVHLIR